MCYHRNTLLYYDYMRIKSYNPDHTKKIRLVTPENISLVIPDEKFVCHVQVVTTSRYQERNLGLDISSISTDHDSNIIYCHRNALHLILARLINLILAPIIVTSTYSMTH